MLKFTGDVRKYYNFREDFKQMVDSRCSKRDAITLLRTCKQGKLFKLIKGIVSDYEAAWEYLDLINGDPRFVADTITHDVAKFKVLRDFADEIFW